MMWGLSGFGSLGATEVVGFQNMGVIRLMRLWDRTLLLSLYVCCTEDKMMVDQDIEHKGSVVSKTFSPQVIFVPHSSVMVSNSHIFSLNFLSRNLCIVCTVVSRCI